MIFGENHTIFVVLVLLLGIGIDHPGQGSDPASLPDLQSSCYSSDFSDDQVSQASSTPSLPGLVDPIQEFKDFQATDRENRQERHMDNIRQRMADVQTSRVVAMHHHEGHEAWLDGEEQRDPMPQGHQEALRAHYHHHLQQARNHAAVDQLDMVHLTVGERFVLESPCGDSPGMDSPTVPLTVPSNCRPPHPS